MRAQFIFDRGSLTFELNLSIIPRIDEQINFLATTDEEAEIEAFLNKWEDETGYVPRVYWVRHNFNDGEHTVTICITCAKE